MVSEELQSKRRRDNMPGTEQQSDLFRQPWNNLIILQQTTVIDSILHHFDSAAI